MPELGDIQFSTIGNNKQVYKVCPDCGRNFWCRVDKDWKTCRLCAVKVGKTYINQAGVTYIKLDKDDQFYPMTVSLSLMGSGWVRLTRLILAKHLGRCLEEGEAVFHRNRNKNDNTIENLYLSQPKPKKANSPEDTKMYNKGYQVGYEEGCKEGYDKCFAEYQQFREEHGIT
jgi:hypothetical protein